MNKAKYKKYIIKLNQMKINVFIKEIYVAFLYYKKLIL